MTDEEYREYQKKLMDDCWTDAAKLLDDNSRNGEHVFDIAIAFFDKRCSPKYYAQKEESE